MTTETEISLRDQIEQWRHDLDDALEDIENFAEAADLDAITMAICAHAAHTTEIIVHCVRQRVESPTELDILRKQCEVVQSQLAFQLQIVENRARLELTE